ncbi:MAG: DinB family protein [Chloroflexota bacterium]|nr:DinB family protein [Chloroflexota bacterium]
MRSCEVATFWRYIASSLDRLVGLVDGLDEEGLNWRPPAPGANSLNVLAAHTLGNAEENLLEILGGRRVGRDREAEFGATADARASASLRERWQGLRVRIEAAVAVLPPAELDREREHPRRGTLTGRDVLIVVARHAAEHLGQAELTRDLLLASRGEG